MRKQREFWINPDDIWNDCGFHEGYITRNEFRKQIHVREVNPEIDEAILEMEKALEWISHSCMNDDHCPSRVDMRVKAKQTLASYKAALEGK